jgi:3-hydroxy-9,10-secoandrosta-1,3,5(10)-triene-9,17-dione monooxygenase
MRESALVFQNTESLDVESKLRLRAQNAFAVAQSREAVDTLWSFYGANAIYTRDPLQRYLRDVQAASQHFSFNFDIAGSAYGTAALGGKYVNPTL